MSAFLVKLEECVLGTIALVLTAVVGLALPLIAFCVFGIFLLLSQDLWHLLVKNFLQ